MMNITLHDAAAWTQGIVLSDSHAELSFTSVSTDTRTLQPGALFFALQGRNFDAHDHLAQAAAAGAAGVVVHRDVEVPAGLAALRVNDTLTALGDFAHAYRTHRHTGRVVALTGSSGKTTTKEMLRSVLGDEFPTFAARGNLNNLIGLPLMLLEAPTDSAFIVLELGMNQPGELLRLTKIAEPDILIFTNIQNAHVGNFGDIDGLYDAECDALRAAPPHAHLIVCIDSPLAVRAVEEHWSGRARTTISAIDVADIAAENIKPLAPYGYTFELVLGDSRSAVSLPTFGRHNVTNAALAAAAGLHAGRALENIAKSLTEFQAGLNRSEVANIRGVHVIKDYYNATPAAVLSALASLADFTVPGRRFAVLADMRELGDLEHEMHVQVGEAAARAGLHTLITLGNVSRIISDTARALGTNAQHVGSLTEADAWLRANLQPGDLVLIKGSRLMKLEDLFTMFSADSQP